MNILLVNPWITDFKAYDEWMRPLPLYRFLEQYRSAHDITLLDCMGAPAKKKQFNTADFESEEIDKPAIFRKIPRKYRRYGISLRSFRDKLAACPEPDIVLITALMTWWYPGVETAVNEIRAAWPGARILLGGIYPALMNAHAGHFGEVGGELLDGKLYGPPATRPALLTAGEMRDVLPLRLIRGCPDACPYCASRMIHGKPIIAESHERSFARLEYFAKSGGEDVVFYDDAPLYQFDLVLKPFLERSMSKGFRLRFHFPNGMHARMMNERRADLLFSAGVKTVRLGFERAGKERKATVSDLQKAVLALQKAGFGYREIGVYVMAGLEPGLEGPEQWAASVHNMGARVYVNQFCPVPGSRLYDAIAARHPEITREPLYHNDLTWIFTHGGFDWDETWEFKRFVRELNGKL